MHLARGLAARGEDLRQKRIFGVELAQAAEELVVALVGDLGVSEFPVAPVVVADQFREFVGVQFCDVEIGRSPNER